MTGILHKDRIIIAEFSFCLRVLDGGRCTDAHPHVQVHRSALEHAHPCAGHQPESSLPSEV